jgi:hypothetical protein
MRPIPPFNPQRSSETHRRALVVPLAGRDGRPPGVASRGIVARCNARRDPRVDPAAEYFPLPEATPTPTTRAGGSSGPGLARRPAGPRRDTGRGRPAGPPLT